jgi:hypothetical protein
MMYHLLCFDKSFRSNCKNNACKIEKSRNSNQLYSKLLLNVKKSSKMINMKKIAPNQHEKVRDSKQFSCTSSKSSGPQLREVQAYKRGKYRLAKLQEVQPHQRCSSATWLGQFRYTNAAVQRKWPIGMTQGSSGALTRQFRNATLRSSDATNASIHLEHAKIFTFVGFLFYHYGNFCLF